MSGTSERVARMALTAAMDGGDPAVADLVERLGAQGAWAAILEGALGEPTARRAAATSPEEVRGRADQAGARFLVPGDQEWPDRLDDLGRVPPIQRRGGRPVGLWVRGPGHLGALTERSVAIVGSRAATAYGAGVAADLAADLAEQGVTVISGGAFGIDAAAHRGALSTGGPSVGVVANGVDVAYPPAHRRLFDVLGAGHLVVSELPPGAHPTRIRFLARNRLIAAMAAGTVVVEAALRSGARNTAGWALECGRPLMAVPGPVHSVASAAPHLMIRSGQAVLVTGAGEVLELISAMGQHTVTPASTPTRPTDALDEIQALVHEALSARRFRPAGDVALAAGLNVPTCLAALGVLESHGLAAADERGWRAVAGGATKTHHELAGGQW